MAECDAHRYLVGVVDEIKQLTFKIIDSQQDQREIITKLAENLLELQRFNISIDERVKELRQYNEKQDARISGNSEFVIKSTAVLGFIVVMSPIIMWMMKP